MKRILLFLVLLLPVFSHAQLLVGFGGNQCDDTAYTCNGIRVDGHVRFLTCKTIGTDTALMAYDLYGRGYKITKSMISKWATGGGGTPGIDDVLAVGQVLTDNRTIDQGGNELTFEDAYTFSVRGFDDYLNKWLLEVDGISGNVIIGDTKNAANGTSFAVRDGQEQVSLQNVDGETFFNLAGTTNIGDVLTRVGTGGEVQFQPPTGGADSTVFAPLYRVDTAKADIRANHVRNSRTIGTTSPLAGGGDLSADRTISIADAGADGTTKGAATFTANDFNASMGLISLDYTNGQKATNLIPGFLSTTDWTNFTNKQAALISGTNIKTINGVSILGPGDLPVTSGITVGTTSISSGSNTRVMYDNAGVVGLYATSGTGNVVLNNGPTFIAPLLGTPASGVATNLTGLPLTTGVTGVLPSANGGAGSVNGIMKANGSGTTSAAVSGTDYAPATSGTSILKGNGAGGFSNAASGTDYAPATSGASILYGNGSGGFSNVTVSTGLDFAGGILTATGGGGGATDRIIRTGATYNDLRQSTDSFFLVTHSGYGGLFRRVSTVYTDTIGVHVHGSLTNLNWERINYDELNPEWWYESDNDFNGTNDVGYRIQAGVTKAGSLGIMSIKFSGNYSVKAREVTLNSLACGSTIDGNRGWFNIETGASREAIFILSNWDCKSNLVIKGFNMVGDSSNLVYSANQYGIRIKTSLRSPITIDQCDFVGFNSSAILMEACGQSAASKQTSNYGNVIKNCLFTHPKMQRSNLDSCGVIMDTTIAAVINQYAVRITCGEAYTLFDNNRSYGYNKVFRSESGNGRIINNTCALSGVNIKSKQYTRDTCYSALFYLIGGGANGLSSNGGKWEFLNNTINHNYAGVLFYNTQKPTQDFGAYGPIISKNFFLANFAEDICDGLPAPNGNYYAPHIWVEEFEGTKITENQFTRGVTGDLDSTSPEKGKALVILKNCAFNWVAGNTDDAGNFLQQWGTSHSSVVAANQTTFDANPTKQNRYYHYPVGKAVPANYESFMRLDMLPAKATDPTAWPNGDRLMEGDRYINTTTGELRRYNGSAFQAFSVTVGSISGLASNMATFLGTATSANFFATVSDETGGAGGVVVGNNAPAITNPSMTGLTMVDNTNMVLNTTNGTKIGTATSQKIGFWNATPIEQPSGLITTALSNSGLVASPRLPGEWVFAISDETTDITTGTAKITFRAPFAATITAVRASVNTVSSSGLPTFDINEAGTTILSTKLTIDASEKTSTTAATPAVISDTAIADDAEITVDIDVAGTGAKGAKLIIYYTRQ